MVLYYNMVQYILVLIWCKVVRVLRPSMSRCIRIGHTFAWAGLQWVGQGVVRHEWGVLNTASAAFSHREGSIVTRVAVQSRGPRNTHREREVTYLQLGSPAICMRVAVCLHMQTNGLLYLLPTPTQTNQLKLTCEGSTNHNTDYHNTNNHTGNHTGNGNIKFAECTERLEPAK